VRDHIWLRIKNCGDGEGFGRPASINAQNLMAFSLNNLNSYSYSTFSFDTLIILSYQVIL
jgi:hypothetical protein